MVRAYPGVLSTEVYSIGTEKYVVEYSFRNSRGALFTGGIGIGDLVLSDGLHMYTNDTPSGQPDNNGFVELDFLRNTIEEMYENCHLAPSFDNSVRLLDAPAPVRKKIDMR
jgi:hypothetical protein